MLIKGFDNEFALSKKVKKSQYKVLLLYLIKKLFLYLKLA